MDDKLVTIRRAGLNDEFVQIIFGKGAELPSTLSLVEQTFRNCFKKKDVQIIVDMTNIILPPTKFIAVLLEATNVARRLGGDVKLINVSNSTKINFMTFSVISYLSIESSEEYALYDFDEKIDLTNIKKKELEITSTKKKTKDETNALKKVKPKNIPPKKSDKLFIPDFIEEDKIKVHSDADSLYKICDFVTNMAEKAGIANREIGKIKVTVYEACLNVVEHAYFSNPENWIEVTVGYDKEKFIIIIHDWGQGFEFSPKKQYDVEQAVKDRRTGGFGMYIIQRSVDDIHYETDPQLGNKLTLMKFIKSENG